MAKRDYYDILGVDRQADQSAIRNAYRKKAMQYHPDRNAGDDKAEARFKEVAEAYEALKDPEKKAAYDRYGHAAFENGRGASNTGFEQNAHFSDIFDQMFGDVMGRRGGQRSQRQNRGEDLRHDIKLTLKDCYHGGKRRIDIQAPGECEACAGSGAAEGTGLKICGQCKGSGTIRIQQGFFTLEQTCNKCMGQGKTIEKPCRPCMGSGRVSRRKTMEVDIAPGIDHNNRIRVTHEGGVGKQGGPAGDLYIFITVERHPLFERDGHTLYCRVPISITDAIMGGAILIPAIEGGQTRLKIPAGIQSGTQLKLRAKGMPKLRGGGSRGDMVVEIDIETPQSLSRDQMAHIKALEESLGRKKNHLPKISDFERRVNAFLKEA